MCVPVLPGRLLEPAFKVPGKDRKVGEATLQGNFSNAIIGVGDKHSSGFFQTQTQDKLKGRLPYQSMKNTVKMKFRKISHIGQLLQGKLPVEMGLDIIKGAVDA